MKSINYQIPKQYIPKARQNIMSMMRYKAAHLTMQMIFHRPQGHILIDKKALISISTVSNQIHKIRMMQKTQHENLHQKFPISLKPISVELFYSNNLQRQAYALNITTPTYKANMIACCPSSHIRATKLLIHLSNS